MMLTSTRYTEDGCLLGLIEQAYQHIRVPDKGLELVPLVVGRSREEPVTGIMKHEDNC